MSLAVLTDSTTAQLSPALTLRPTAGNSTKTTSVNSSWAWSVMPMAAVSPLTRTHSWLLTYFKSPGTFALIIYAWKLTPFAALENLFSAFAVKWLGHDEGGRLLASNLNANGCVGRGALRRHVAQSNAQAEGGALRAAGHCAEVC